MGKHSKKQKSSLNTYSKFGSCGALAVGFLGAIGAIKPSVHADSGPGFIALSDDLVGFTQQNSSGELYNPTLATQGRGASRSTTKMTNRREHADNYLRVVERRVAAHTFLNPHESVPIAKIQMPLPVKQAAVVSRPVYRPAVFVPNIPKISVNKFHEHRNDHLSHQSLTPAGRIVHNLIPVKGYRAAAVRAALTRLGKPYSWGSTGPNAFDCSGLMVWSYHQVGITLPRDTWGQLTAGTPVNSLANLQPGDLVIYAGGTHVGMYIGNGMMVHSPTFGQTVEIKSVTSEPIYAMRHI